MNITKAGAYEMDEKWGGEKMVQILGPSGLGYTNTDSSRLNMMTAFIKQTLTLKNPDVPRLSTSYENLFGKHNTSFRKINGSWEVVDIIRKFPNAPLGIYTVVLYNKDTNTYDMMEKQYAQSLTERFGFLYNNTVLDSLVTGDIVADKVVSKSNSYDDNMNYRYGKNANVYYSTSNDTLEDKIQIRKGWAEGVISNEVDDVEVSINNNDILLNLYGDDDTYLAFPEIGDVVKDSTVCATRRVNKAHMFYQFQTQNMQHVKDTDTDYFVTKNSIVYDIDVFYNGDEEFPDNIFYRQLKKYYEYNNEYAKNMLEWTNMIKMSGSNYTPDVTFFRSKYMHYNDPEYKWENKRSVFGNIMVHFKVYADVKLDYGSKMSGRFGDKGVVGTIVDDSTININNLIDALEADFDGKFTDEERHRLSENIEIVDDVRMPYSDDCIADIMLNMSGSIRRLNPGQLCEREVNFAGEEVRKMIVKAKDIEEKKYLFFKFLNIVNHDQCTFFRGYIEGLNRTIKIGGREVMLVNNAQVERFIESVEKDGFYIIRPPHKPLLKNDITRIYDEFPDIKPVQLYVNIFGMKKRKIIKHGIIGSRYMLILKQNTNKKFSARSTYRVNRSNLPTKDTAKKTNRTSYARTPVRLSEIYNVLASFSGRTLAEYNIFMRSSTIGRKALSSILASTGNPLAVKALPIRDNFSNTNADILNARLKAIGIEIKFTHSSTDQYAEYAPDAMVKIQIEGYNIYDTLEKRAFYNCIISKYVSLYKSFSYMETYVGEKSDVVWDKIFANKDSIYDNHFLTKEMEANLRDITAVHLVNFDKLLRPEVKKEVITEIDDSGNVVIKKKRGRKPKGWKPEDDIVHAVIKE